MQIARIVQSMVQVSLVLFAFQRYGSAPLAGAVTFAFLMPGLLISPIAGALLDRHGRTRLVMLDYAVGTVALMTITALSLAGQLPPWLLIVIAALSGLTLPLSSSGLRSLFPLIVPEPLWERANAVDSNGSVLANIVAGPLAGIATQFVGFEPTFIGMSFGFAAAVVLMQGAPDPRTNVISTGRLLLDAWQGLVYTWRNPTLRALAVCLSGFNVAYGLLEIFLPAIILTRLGYGQSVVGLMFGLQGLAGVISASLAGRVRTEGRERRMIAIPITVTGFGLAFFLVPGLGLLPIAIAMCIAGLLNGPLDVAFMSLRQRRTDPAWMGRAFTVSMYLNFAGFPIGTAIAGASVGISLEGTIVAAVIIAIASGLLAIWLIPRHEPRPSLPEFETTEQVQV